MGHNRMRSLAAAVLNYAVSIAVAQPVYADFQLGEDFIDKLLPDHSLNNTISASEAADTISRFRDLGVVITGLGAITCVFFLALSITKLGAAGDNDQARRRAIAGLATSSVAVAILGGLSVYLGFFWKFL